MSYMTAPKRLTGVHATQSDGFSMCGTPASVLPVPVFYWESNNCNIRAARRVTEE